MHPIVKSSLFVSAVAAAVAIPFLVPQEHKTPQTKSEALLARTGIQVCAPECTSEEAARKHPNYRDARARYDKMFSHGSFGNREKLGGLSACFAPDTPDYVIVAFHDALAAAADGAWPPLGEGPSYNLNSGRWGTTNGTPQALTWSFVPDGLSISSGAGEPVAGSVLFSSMDSKFAAQGGRATWIGVFNSIFARWQQLSGLSYTRVTSGGNDWDDGQPWGSGSAATRGSLRIASKNIDGASGILAYNYFPTNGDMVIDSSDNWGSTTNNWRFLRNTLSHEHGHGMGLNHVCPLTNSKLMEPFLNTGFDGPQHDDIRAAQHRYGDDFEPNGTAATASNLGTLSIPSTTNFGGAPADVTYPTMPVPSNSAVSALSPSTDDDYYKFTVSGPGRATVTITPVGATYDSSTQASGGGCNSGNIINSATIADLQFEVRDTNGTTVLLTRNATVAGAVESASVDLPAAGTYFVRVSSATAYSNVQMYTGQVALAVVNIAPVLDPIGAKNFPELATFNHDCNATDANAGQTLTFSLSGAPSGMTINPTTGLISWNPAENQAPGTVNFTVMVTDNGTPNLSDSETVSWTANEVNQAPVLSLTPPGPYTLVEGQTLNISGSAVDGDLPANALTYSLVGAPTGATINSGSGAFQWTPTSAQIGGHNFSIRATDNGSPTLNDTEPVSVSVNISNKVLSGVITLGDFGASPTSVNPATLEIMAVGGSTALQSHSPSMGAGGNYSQALSGLVGGNYDVYAKVSHWLRKKAGSVLFSASGATVNFTLTNGDVDNDNEVGPGDFSDLTTAFGSVSGDSNWNANADLDGDGEVGPSDFSIVATNFGLSGD